MDDNYLSPIIRLYVYGIHGYFTEVMFTAVWEFVVNTNWKFPGCTSVWSLFIYSGCSFLIEKVFVSLENKVPMIFRGFIYLFFCYMWELVAGLVLRYFNACPWDYTEFKYNFLGVITLEYAPLWYLAVLIQEQLLTKNMLKLQWKCEKRNSSMNSVSNEGPTSNRKRKIK
jgi:hypothetical protein